MMMIPLSRSVKINVETLECPPCHPISKRMIWATSRRYFNRARYAMIRPYELQVFHCPRYGAMQFLSLHALLFQICHIRPGP